MITINKFFAFTFVALFAPLGAAIEPGEKVITPDTVIEPGAPTTARQNRYAQFSQEEKDNFLIHEVSADHSGNVHLLIEAGANVNYIDNSGTDAMGAAFEQSNIAILEMLLNAEALDNTDAITCIDDDIRTYEEARACFLQKVIEAKAINPRKYANILSWAQKRGGYPDLIDAIEKRNKELPSEAQMYEWYKKLSAETRKKLLIQAVKSNDLEDTKALLNAGANPDTVEEISSGGVDNGCEPDCRIHYTINGVTPILTFAILSKNIPMAQELISHGANVNANMMESKGIYYSAIDSFEIIEVIKPLLVRAIEFGCSELVRLLIDNKANLNQCCVNIVWSLDDKIEDYSTSCETPLSRAIELGNAEIIEILKAAGAQ
jgi:ankyrin repeat protein